MAAVIPECWGCGCRRPRGARQQRRKAPRALTDAAGSGGPPSDDTPSSSRRQRPAQECEVRRFPVNNALIRRIDLARHGSGCDAALPLPGKREAAAGRRGVCDPAKFLSPCDVNSICVKPLHNQTINHQKLSALTWGAICHVPARAGTRASGRQRALGPHPATGRETRTSQRIALPDEGTERAARGASAARRGGSPPAHRRDGAT